MSTVAPSTSNIERSPHFVSRNAQAKNQATNPAASTFAALLMSAEQGEPSASLEPSDPLADDGRASTDTAQGNDSTPPSDAGQAALAGLMSWQALSAPDSTAQGMTGNAAPSTGAATNARYNVSLVQIDPSKHGKVLPDAPTDSSPDTGPATPAPVVTQTFATALPKDSAPQVSSSAAFSQSTASNGLAIQTAQTTPQISDKTDDTQSPTLNAPSIQTGKAAPQVSDSAAFSQSTAPNGLSIQPAQTTASTANAPVPGIDTSGIVSTAAPADTSPIDPSRVTAAQPAMEALVNGADKTGASKARIGSSRHPLPTGTAITKTSSGASLQSNAQNVQADEPDLLPRTTFDLVTKQASETTSDTAKADAQSIESTPFKLEGARSATETGAPGTEHMQTGDHAPLPLAPTDPAPSAEMTPDSMADIMDNLSGQIAYWAAQGTQRASLTVGDDKDNPLEVNISMRDGEVHVAFEAAQVEVRDALTTSAEALLKNMLESKGMTLGDVTVGQRQQSTNQENASAENRQGSDSTGAQRSASGTQLRAATGDASPLAQPHRRPAIATANKLDLFA